MHIYMYTSYTVWYICYCYSTSGLFSGSPGVLSRHLGSHPSTPHAVRVCVSTHTHTVHTHKPAVKNGETLSPSPKKIPNSIHTYIPMYLQICCPEMNFAAAHRSACRGPGPVLPLVPLTRDQARACAEPCGNLNYVSLSTFVNVIAHACVSAY